MFTVPLTMERIPARDKSAASLAEAPIFTTADAWLTERPAVEGIEKLVAVLVMVIVDAFDRRKVPLVNVNHPVVAENVNVPSTVTSNNGVWDEPLFTTT